MEISKRFRRLPNRQQLTEFNPKTDQVKQDRERDIVDRFLRLKPHHLHLHRNF